MAQWERIHLPMQETQVPSLIQEDPTCLGGTKPFATIIEPVLEPGSGKYRNPHTLEPILGN